MVRVNIRDFDDVLDAAGKRDEWEAAWRDSGVELLSPKDFRTIAGWSLEAACQSCAEELFGTANNVTYVEKEKCRRCHGSEEV